MPKSKRKSSFQIKPTVPIDDDQRNEILQRLSAGEDPAEIARDMGIKRIQISAVKAHMTQGTYG